MNTERLLRLADLVETIAPEKFDLRTWGDKNGCGTVGCAVGWGSQDKWFIAQGLLSTWRFGILGIYVGPTEQFFDVDTDSFWFLFSEDSYVTRPAHPSEVAIRIRLFVEHHDEKVVRELESV